MRACCCRVFLDLGALRFPGLRTCLRLWASPLPRQTRLPRVFKCTCCSRTRARNSLAPRSLHVARVWRALPHRRHDFSRFGGMSVSLPMLEPQNKTSEHDHVVSFKCAHKMRKRSLVKQNFLILFVFCLWTPPARQRGISFKLQTKREIQHQSNLQRLSRWKTEISYEAKKKTVRSSKAWEMNLTVSRQVFFWSSIASGVTHVLHGEKHWTRKRISPFEPEAMTLCPPAEQAHNANSTAYSRRSASKRDCKRIPLVQHAWL